MKTVKIVALFLVSLVRRHFLSCSSCFPYQITLPLCWTLCALEKILLLHNKRFNHQDQRCGTKGVTFTLLLQFTKERVSKASLKHPHILQRALLFHRHFSEASATQLPKTVAKVHAKQGSLVCQKVCQPRLLKPRKLSRYV